MVVVFIFFDCGCNVNFDEGIVLFDVFMNSVVCCGVWCDRCIDCDIIVFGDFGCNIVDVVNV